MTNDFLECFLKSDAIFILPIYTAGEKKIKKIDNIYLSKLLQKKYKKKYIEPVVGTISFYKKLISFISQGDNVIFLGAGHSSKIANNFSKFYIKNA